jgi:hypothetical protein
MSSEFRASDASSKGETKSSNWDMMMYWLEPASDRQGGEPRSAGRMRQVFDGVKQMMAQHFLDLQGRFQLYYVLIPGDVVVDAKDVHFPWDHRGEPSAEAEPPYNWNETHKSLGANIALSMPHSTAADYEC